MQSPATMHVFPFAQRAQAPGPPQSTSVSVPSFRPSMHVAATHLPLPSHTVPPLSVHVVPFVAGVVPQQPAVHAASAHVVVGGVQSLAEVHAFAPPAHPPPVPIPPVPVFIPPVPVLIPPVPALLAVAIPPVAVPLVLVLVLLVVGIDVLLPPAPLVELLPQLVAAAAGATAAMTKARTLLVFLVTAKILSGLSRAAPRS
jgi:hypothetical protein